MFFNFLRVACNQNREVMLRIITFTHVCQNKSNNWINPPQNKQVLKGEDWFFLHTKPYDKDLRSYCSIALL